MRYAIVTGCSGQLGSCLTKHLCKLGWGVIGVDLELKSTCVEDETFEFHQLDVTNQHSVKEFYKGLESRRLIIEGLVNNVGTAVFTPFEHRTSDEVLSVTATNINAPIFMVQGFLPLAASDYRASIVNIGSIYGLIAPDQALYSDTPRNSSEIYGMTKAAIINLTQYLAVYLGKNQIRCNCVSPGGVHFHQGPEFIKNYSKKVPMGRMAYQEEIVEGICYLLDCKQSSYVNGANLVIDGGFTSWR